MSEFKEAANKFLAEYNALCAKYDICMYPEEFERLKISGGDAWGHEELSVNDIDFSKLKLNND